MEREKSEVQQSTYQMGAEWAQKKIDDIVGTITGETTDFELVDKMEAVERYELQIKQNLRRHMVFIEGKPINENGRIQPSKD